MINKRIQQKRIKGWRMPLGAKSVARPSNWGNPFEVWKNREWYADRWDPDMRCMGFAVKCIDQAVAHEVAVKAYREAIHAGWHAVPTPALIRAELAGMDLACFCPPGLACHADVLLELASQ